MKNINKNVNSQKGFVVQGIIALTALILIVGGAYYAGTKNVVAPKVEDSSIPQNNPNMVDQDRPNSDWKTLINTDEGYNISYPATYHTAYGSDILNYDESKYEKGNPKGVKIQIQKVKTVEASNAGNPIIKLSEKVTSGPGGVFDIYSVVGINGTKYFQILVWGSENDGQIVSEIFATFKFTTPIVKTPASTHTSIKVLSPKLGEKIKAGSTYIIKWTSDSKVSNKVFITLKLSAGLQQAIYTESGIPNAGPDLSVKNTGSISWLVPGSFDDLNGSPIDRNHSGVIEIRDAVNKNIVASSAIFEIVPANKTVTTQPSIKVLSPNGGEVWKMGSTQTIKWQSSIDLKNKISIQIYEYKQECYPSSTNSCPTIPVVPVAPPTIATDIANTGEYKWVVGSPFVYGGTVSSGKKYRIEILGWPNDNSSTISDTSDNYLTITN